MKLSRTVMYALKATLQLAQEPGGVPVPCSRLASRGEMPERFLLQILRSLVTHGILRSTRGVDGGYILLKNPDSISVLDVIEAIDGPLSHEVVFGTGLSLECRERLTSALEQVSTTAEEQLRSIKLSHLVLAGEYRAPIGVPQSLTESIVPSCESRRTLENLENLSRPTTAPH